MYVSSVNDSTKNVSVQLKYCYRQKIVNIILIDIISGNLTATIFDHLPQFLRAPEILRDFFTKKYIYFDRDWTNFNQENFILDYFSVDWKNIINLQKNNFNCPQSFFDSVNDLLTIHAT